MFTQAATGTKEGVMEGITNITDAIIRTSDGTNLKDINVYQLFELINVTFIINNQPKTLNIHDQLQDILGRTFNFQQKVVVNIKQLWAKAAGLNTYCIAEHKDTIALIILASIKDTAKHEWSSELCTTMHTIRRQYAYDSMHAASSVTTILTELATADQNHNMSGTPSPSDISPQGSTHILGTNLLYLNVLVNAEMDYDTTTYGEAYAATSNIESSGAKLHQRACNREKNEKKSTRS